MFIRQVIKFYLFWKISIDDPPATIGINFSHQFGQAVIGLRPNHNIHPRGPPGNFRTFGLGNASSNRNRHAAAFLIGITFF